MTPRTRSRPPDPEASPLEMPSAIHNVGSWISRWSLRRPDRLAWADDAQRFSYAEAELRIRRLTSWLLAQEVEAGDRIALWLGNRVATLEALFACARVGAIALPINARLTAAEVAFQLDDSRPKLVFVEPAWRERAEQAVALAASV